jgi:hypothetical protein
MSLTNFVEPQPSLAWTFESSNVDYVTNLTPSAQVSPGPGQLVGSAALVTDAPTSNTAVYFPGTGNDYMNLGISSPTNFDLKTSNCFVEAWCYIGDSGGYLPISSKAMIPSGTSCWLFSIINSKIDIRIKPQDFSVAFYSCTGSTTITSGRWYHFAFSYVSLTSTTGTMYVFVDGVSDATGVSFPSPGPLFDSNIPYTIGNSRGSIANGYIRDLRVVQGGVVPTTNFTPLASAPFSYASPGYVPNMGTTVFTLLGQFITYVPGKYLNSMRLTQTVPSSGANNYVLWSMGSSPINIDATGITVSAWVNFNTFSGSFVSIYDSFSNVIGLSMTSALTRTGQGFSGTQQLKNATTISATNSTGTWYHVALTYDSTSVILYRNGVGSTPIATGSTGGVVITGLRVGSQANNINPSYSGYQSADCTLEDLRIYNTALTASQVQSIYTQGGAPASNFRVMPQPSLAWDFNGTTTPYIGTVSSTAVNGSITYGTGKYAQDIIMNGTSNIVYNISDQIVLDTGFTIAFWLKPLNVTTAGWIYDISATNYSDRLYASIQNNGYLSFVYLGFAFYSPYPLSVGTWYHITVTLVAGMMTLYWNGTYSAQSAQSTTGVILANKLSIAALVGGQGPNINAEYDDLRVYNTALSAAQVQSIYRAQGMPSRGVVGSNDRQIYVAPVGTYPTYTPTSGAQFPVFNTSNVSFYSSGGTSGGTAGQYLNFGSQTFNMSMGFSAVCQFAFTNGIGFWERIFDFSNGADSDNILFSRNYTSTILTFEIYNNNVSLGKLSTPAVLNQNQVYTAIVVYNPYIGQYGTAYIYFQGATYSLTYTAAPRSLNRTLTYVGRSAFSGDAYSNVNINYLSVYNRVLTSDEINMPLPTPQITLKGAPLFNQISQSAASSAVGAFSLRAVNGVTAKAVQVQAHPVVTWPPIAFTGGGDFTATGTYNGVTNGVYKSRDSFSPTSSAGSSWVLFDKNDSTYYIGTSASYNTNTGVYLGSNSTTISSVSVLGEWVQLQSPVSFILRNYTITSRPNLTSQAPTTFWIAGSNDGTTWSNVHYQGGITLPPVVGLNITVPQTSNSLAYSYYRLVASVLGNSTDTNFRNVLAFVTWDINGDAPSYAPNPAQDFYADERGNLLTAPVVGTTLQNWLGGATGYVTKWYDQSGKGNDASQNTAANQPIIQRATKGPGYSALFNGTTNYMNFGSSTILNGTNYSVCASTRRNASGSNKYYIGSNGGGSTRQNLAVGYFDNTTIIINEGGYATSTVVPAYSAGSEPTGYDFVMLSQTTGAYCFCWRNGTSYPGGNTGVNLPLNSAGVGIIGAVATNGSYAGYFSGEMFEILVLTSSLFDLSGSSIGQLSPIPSVISQIYQNQLGAYGT